MMFNRTREKLRAARHRMAHRLRWNHRSVVSWWDKENLWTGVQCDHCGEYHMTGDTGYQRKMADLDTTTFDELWNAIRTRFDAAILIVDGKEKLEGEFAWNVCHEGTPSHVRGLLITLNKDIKRQIRNLEYEMHDDEDDD